MHRVSQLDEPADLHAPDGTPEKARGILMEIISFAKQLDADAESVAGWLDIAENKGIHKVLGYTSFGAMILKECKIDEHFAAAIRKAPKGTTVADARSQAENARKQADPKSDEYVSRGGQPGNTNALKDRCEIARKAKEKTNHADGMVRFGDVTHNRVKAKQGSNQTEYLLRRMARDHPDILDQYERGEYPSVRQAAIAAGIIKVPSNLEKAKKAIMRLTDEEYDQLCDWIDNELPQG